MSTESDYYDVLHVAQNAPTALIHATFRTLMQRLASMSDNARAHEQAALLAEAYAVLSNPERRAAYDLQRQRAASQREADFAATAVLQANR